MTSTPVTLDVPLRTDEHGVIRIGNTRVTLLTIIGRHRAGATAEQIHLGFPTVSLRDIYAVLAYYLAHQDEIDTYISQEEAEGERLRREHQDNSPRATAFNEKMRTLLAAKHGNERG